MIREGHALRVERLLDAPRERVFDAWTNPAQLAVWFHFNDEWPIEEARSDPRVGGEVKISWRAPDGTLWHESGEYLEIVRPEKLVLTCRYDFPGFDEGETLLTVEFRQQGNQTLLVLVQEGYRNATNRDNHQQGWPGFLDQLVALLRSEAVARGESR